MNLTNSSTVIDQGGPVGSLREALIGAWQLVACVETDVETGEIFLPMGPHPAGFILYTPDGYMSAQLSSPDRADFASDDMYRGTPEDYVAAGTSYLAYSGPYRIDEARRTVEHRMAVSLFPNWQGQRQLRIPELDGETLVLATDRPTLFPAASRPPASLGAGRRRTSERPRTIPMQCQDQRLAAEMALSVLG